ARTSRPKAPAASARSWTRRTAAWPGSSRRSGSARRRSRRSRSGSSAVLFEESSPMKVENITLPKKYHDAVEHWRRHNFKDYDTLLESWEKYFPKDEKFCLCAKLELGTPDVIHIGEQKGEKKRLEPEQLSE